MIIKFKCTAKFRKQRLHSTEKPEIKLKLCLLMYFFLQKVVNSYFAIRNVDTETLRPKHSKYYTHDLCLAPISHSSLVQKIHAGIVFTSQQERIECTKAKE